MLRIKHCWLPFRVYMKLVLVDQKSNSTDSLPLVVYMWATPYDLKSSFTFPFSLVFFKWTYTKLLKMNLHWLPLLGCSFQHKKFSYTWGGGVSRILRTGFLWIGFSRCHFPSKFDPRIPGLIPHIYTTNEHSQNQILWTSMHGYCIQLVT